MEQNGTNLLYTGKQQKAAEMLANPDFTGTITELIETVGVPLIGVYRLFTEKRLQVQYR